MKTIAIFLSLTFMYSNANATDLFDYILANHYCNYSNFSKEQHKTIDNVYYYHMDKYAIYFTEVKSDVDFYVRNSESSKIKEECLRLKNEIKGIRIK